MAKKVIRIKQLATTKGTDGMLPVSPATIWRWLQKDLFVRPYKLSPGVTVWNVDEIEAWLAEHKHMVM